MISEDNFHVGVSTFSLGAFGHIHWKKNHLILKFDTRVTLTWKSIKGNFRTRIGRIGALTQ